MPVKRTRQLAAIMFADMVGYTRLMQEDEEGARTQRDRHRALFSSVVVDHNGEILQYYGDGVLSIYSSAVEAVECAVRVQAEVRKAGLTPLRIGIHTGDIVYDDEGVYGDSVNVASRIEGLSAPRGILVSGKVLDEIKNHPSISTVPLGAVLLKNVEHPTSVFAIANEGLAVPSREEVQARATSKAVGALPSEASPGTSTTSGSTGEPQGFGEALLRRLSERALIQWVVLYLVGAWAFLQAATFATEGFSLNPALSRGLVVLAVAGFFLTITVAWFHGEKGRQRVGRSESIIIVVILALSGVGLATLTSNTGVPTGDQGAVYAFEGVDRPAVAILPFLTMSAGEGRDPDFLATGLHDDLLTQLSKIAGLDVIARTSVMQYAGTAKDIPTIGRELGVHAILEGSVMQAGGQVRLNVQLIDARTDRHLWAENYTREYTVEDVFSIQSDLASQIASRLRAELAPAERARIAEVPTADLRAYTLYQQGKEIMGRVGWDPADMANSVSLLQQAVAQDPRFALAHAWLSVALCDLYLFYDRTPERLQAAVDAANEALRLDPDLPEGYLGRAYHHLLAYENDEAWAALAEAEEGLPGMGAVLTMKAEIQYRQRLWDEALASRERAVLLDPLNPEVAQQLADSYAGMDRWEDANEVYDRLLEEHPTFYEAAFTRGYLTWRRTGSGAIGLKALAQVPEEVDVFGLKSFFQWLMDETHEGKLAALERIQAPILDFGGFWWAPRELIEAWTYRQIDPDRARRAFQSSVEICRQALEDRPDDPRIRASLGRSLAGLGRREEAVAQAEWVVALLPISQDPSFGRDLLEIASVIYAELGMVEEAANALELILSVPGVPPVGMWIQPEWDSVRDHPRIRAIMSRYEEAPPGLKVPSQL